MSEMITITKEEYKELLEESRFLHALMAAGVDNWSGYDYAHEIMGEWDDEDGE